MDRLTQELLMGEVLTELSQTGKLHYFGQIASFPGYISTVTKLIGEIKRSGLKPEEMQAVVEAKDSPQKDREIEQVYCLYQQRLSELGLADLEEMYFLAIKALNDGFVRMPYKTLMLSEFYDLTPLQLGIIKVGKASAAIDVSLVYEKDRPEVYQAVESTYMELVGMGFTPRFISPPVQATPALAHLRHELFRVDAAVAPASKGIAVSCCPNRSKEIAVVTAKAKGLLLTENYCPHDILLIVRDIDNYHLLTEKFTEAGIALSMPQKQYLSERPLARLLLNCLLARQTGGQRPIVRNLIKSPYVRYIMPFDADFVDNIIVNNVGNNWSDWLAYLAALPPVQAGEGLRGRRILQLLQNRLVALPLKATCEQHIAALSQLLSEIAIPNQLSAAYRAGRVTLDLLKIELVAYERLLKALERMRDGFAAVGQAARELTIAEFREQLAKAMGAECLPVATCTANAVQVATPDAVRGLCYRAVFILGLSEGEFPQRERESWLYTDNERSLLRDLGVDLMTSWQQRQREDLFFASAAAIAQEYLSLSFIEDSETLPSPYITAVTRLFETIDGVHYQSNEVFASSYDQVFSRRELQNKVLAEAAAAQGLVDNEVLHYVVTQTLDDEFRRRLDAQQQRVRGITNGYNGSMVNCQAKAAIGKLLGANPVFSISALADYAACPFRYFASRVLRLSEWAEAEEDTDNNVLGNLYHETLARFGALHRGEKLLLERRSDYEAELIEAMNAVGEQLLAAGAIVRGPLWEYERRQAQAVLVRWLAFELSEQDTAGLALRPNYFEWGFGLPITPDMDSASVTAPLTLVVDDKQVAICGKIDRIDCAGDKIIVLDYKKQRCPASNDIEKGIDLQVPLYILAVQQYLAGDRGQVIGGGYYALEQPKKDGGMWLEEYKAELPYRKQKRSGNYAAEDWQSMLQAIKTAVVEHSNKIKAGIFPVRPTAPCSPFCPGATICRYDPLRAEVNADV
jgi:ATP-dependent helicase/DNAse subunit B